MKQYIEDGEYSVLKEKLLISYPVTVSNFSPVAHIHMIFLSCTVNNVYVNWKTFCTGTKFWYLVSNNTYPHNMLSIWQ